MLGLQNPPTSTNPLQCCLHQEKKSDCSTNDNKKKWLRTMPGLSAASVSIAKRWNDSFTTQKRTSCKAQRKKYGHQALHGAHGGGRQPMCDPEGCSTVWGAVGGGDPHPPPKAPPPFVDPNPAPFPAGPVQARKHTKLTRCTVNGDCFAALQHFQSSTECCLEFAQRPSLPLVTNHRHIYGEAKGATNIYIEKRREGRGLKHRNHPPTCRVTSCRYSWGEHASLAGLLVLL